MLVFACISPHPPIILPSIGSSSDRRKVAKTIAALNLLAEKLERAKPDLIIISSPHPDWGIKVPWHFLGSRISGLKSADKSWKIADYQNANSPSLNTPRTIYPLLTTLDSPRKHYEWGKQIMGGLPQAKRWAWISSGDMSHRLREDGPYGFDPAGPKFDQDLINLLTTKDVEGILNLDPKFASDAGECGLRSFCILLGALESQKVNWQSKILSYEGPFGVGYLVASFNYEQVY